MVRLSNDLTQKNIESWSTTDVAAWLSSFGMEKYVSEFQAHEVDGVKLHDITENDLELIYKVEKTAHRKKIRRRLMFLQAKRTTTSRIANSVSISNPNDEKESKQHLNSSLSHSNNCNIPLHVHGIEYTFHKTCTFCQESTNIAFVYCPSCNDFLCQTCDQKVHRHMKRSSHKRTHLSKYNATQNGQIIINFFRFTSCRKVLRNKVREVFGRFYDPATKRHYYRNLKTRSIQWYKPLCLGSEELKPLLTRDTATVKLQGVFRCWLAHAVVVRLITEQYFKVYDRQSGRYCYHYNGMSTKPMEEENQMNRNRIQSRLITQRTQWNKPKNLRNADIPLLFTKDLAILRIQLFSRSIITKKRVRALIRSRFERVINPISGNFVYINLVTGVTLTKKPFLLGREPWDPEDISYWDVKAVTIYFRRLGFKKYGYLAGVERYNVDGPLLLAFENTDLKNMGITKSIHIQKTIIDLSKRMIHNNNKNHPIHKHETLIRRDRFRRHHQMMSAAETLQRMFRRRNAQLVAARLRRVIEIQKAKEMEVEKRLKGVGWWPELCENVDVESHPTRKNFGRRAPFESVNGWGTYMGDIWLEADVIKEKSLT